MTEKLAEDYKACRRAGMSHTAAIKQTAETNETASRAVRGALAAAPPFTAADWKEDKVTDQQEIHDANLMVSSWRNCPCDDCRARQADAGLPLATCQRLHGAGRDPGAGPFRFGYGNPA